MTKKHAEEIVDRWVLRERKLRGRGTHPALAMADELSRCRRELQEAAGLVLTLEQVEALVGKK